MAAARGIRPSKEQIDAEILDVTAGLIARRGIKDTAVQAVADAAGYSKTGILNRFPSKELLVEAAIAQCGALARDIYARVVAQQAGSEADDAARDALALAALTDLAMSRRGWIELALSSVSTNRDDELIARLAPMGVPVFAMFGLVDTVAPVSLERRARVTGAIGALAILALTYENDATPERARPLILATCWNALGHAGAFPE
ncbi:TetR/AcrR family transcriptional regulator [Glaciihabitans sp. dw_435]|uniref:TetR/AcrR family transcriptional regulator n=1 Tax=Glaciihabitans sp. dw_435 TaxID=2720081 RepID=UPI001BD1C5AA|nr:TetR/AcrR family transcriptional regulator [Glaciihabitans sp. dw_435]